tara:strand:+ start:108 stop:389 length:282 start_codon:yes stop_codon:yes gene_type:complete
MVSPIEESQDEQDDIVVEVEEVSASSTSKQSDIDFVIDNTDRPDLMLYTVSTKPVGEDHRTLTILAPSYSIALEIAGINKNNTVKVDEVPFEG